MSVNVHLVLSPKRLSEFPGLSEQAIYDALSRSVPRIRQVAMTETPVWTGRLLGSFDIGHGFRSMVFKWETDYAEEVEKGRAGGKTLTPKTAKVMAFPSPWKGGPMQFRKMATQGGFPARNYAAATKQRALDIILDELRISFQAIGG